MKNNLWKKQRGKNKRIVEEKEKGKKEVEKNNLRKN